MADHDRFVNPYSFAGLPSTVKRRVPPGHDGRQYRPPGRPDGEARYSGTIVVEWTTRSPLLLPPAPDDDEPGAGERFVTIPGASVKGALRSVHEALFGGCLRVVDPQYVPSYRSPANSKDDRWWLAQVIESTAAGVPTRVRLGQDIDWIDGPDLARAYRQANAGIPQSGDTFAVSGLPEETTLGRFEIRSAGRLLRRAKHAPAPKDEAPRRLGSPAAKGDRLLLVTDARVRRPVRANGQRGRALWASSPLGDRELPVDEAVAADFAGACAGADDLRRLLAPVSAAAGRRPTESRPGGVHDPLQVTPQMRSGWRGATRFENVRWWPNYEGDGSGPKAVIARRAVVTGLLFPGDAVWVRLSADEQRIERIDLAEIWRETGRGSVASRIPKALLPCSDPGFDASHAGRADQAPVGLCLSCEIFGSVDDRVTAEPGIRSGGEQRSYAGHIRFGPARTAEPVSVRRCDLAPMGQPHPGAGMFYLADPGRLPADRDWNDLPGRWGASPDGSDAEHPRRGLRGRKFYWHSDPDAQAAHWAAALGRAAEPRYRRRTHQREQGRSGWLVDAGTTLRQTIRVDGISESGLQTLLVAIDPGRLFDARSSSPHHGIHLGGGKPLGLGSVTATIGTDSTLTPTADRYRSAPDSPSTAELLTFKPKTILGWLDGSAARQLSKLLDIDGLGERSVLVSYPTTRSWDAVGTREFDESYRYFTENNGEHLKNGDRAWAPLPTVPTSSGAEFDPSQPVRPRRKGL